MGPTPVTSHAGLELEVAEGSTLWGLLQRRAELTPDRTMLLDDQDRAVTFGECVAWSERVAAGLQAVGIGEGTPVSWQLPTRIETVILSLALARLGAVQNPIIHLYREREVGSLLRSTGAEWFVVPGAWKGFDYEDMAERLAAGVDQPFEVMVIAGGLPEGDPASLPAAPIDGTAVRWLYSTSGTTSEPKAVRHADRSLIAAGIALTMATGITEADIGCMPFPYAHIGGPDNLVISLRSGSPVLLLEAFVPDESIPVMRRHGVTMIGGSTAHYLALLQEQRKDPDRPILPSLRLMVGGGAPKPPEIFWQAKSELGVEVRHGYGMTECPSVSTGAAGDTDEQLAQTDGAVVHRCEVRIVDGSSDVVPAGVDGEIQVRGPMLAAGYTDEAANRDLFLADGFFRTGDRGHLRRDGHLVVTGRTKELIIRKGENISPREIEDVLAAHPKVAAVAVIGLADQERGERVCAVVEGAEGVDGGEELSFVEMQDACRSAGLMAQKIPEQLEVVDALPRNPTMKVLKRELARFG